MPATKVESTWSSGNLVFRESVAANGGKIIFGHTNGGLDVQFYGTTSSNNVLFDESANTIISDGVDIRLNDSDYLKLGDSTDASLCWDSAKIALTAATASTFQVGSSGANVNTRLVGTVIVGTTGANTGKNVTIYGTTTANAIKLTAASNRLELDGITLTGSSVASETMSIQAWGTAASTVIAVKNSTGNANVKLGFFAAAPTSQAGNAVQLAASTAYTADVVTRINSLLTLVKNLGLMATS